VNGCARPDKELNAALLAFPFPHVVAGIAKRQRALAQD
jgi:hypothetical protein